MLKYSIAFVLLFIALTASTQSKKAPQEIKHKVIVGNDKDIHGCIGSAGYVWSELKEQCIRTFELDASKDDIAKLSSMDKTQSMVVLYSKDRSKVEIFSSLGKRILFKSKAENCYLYKGKNQTEKLITLKGKLSYISISKKKTTILYQQ